jgi:hypothetical protein
VTGLVRLPAPPFRCAVPTSPANRAGARVDCFPARAAFRKWQGGRHPHCHFRALLRLHACYGPRHPRRPLSRGSSPSGCPAAPLVSYRINRQLSGWNPPPLVIRAFARRDRAGAPPDRNVSKGLLRLDNATLIHHTRPGDTPQLSHLSHT